MFDHRELICIRGSDVVDRGHLQAGVDVTKPTLPHTHIHTHIHTDPQAHTSICHTYCNDISVAIQFYGLWCLATALCVSECVCVCVSECVCECVSECEILAPAPTLS